MRKLKVPNTYVIIAVIIALSAVLTWFVPGGQYVKAEDGTLSYEAVDAVPQTWQVLSAVYHGFVKQAGIIVFILVVGGAFWLLNATGAVEVGIQRFIALIGKRDILVLVALTVLFSLAGAVFGMSEETIPFVGIVVPLVVSMGSVKVWEKLRAMGLSAELHTLALREHCFQRTASPGTGSYTWLDRIQEFFKSRGLL